MPDDPESEHRDRRRRRTMARKDVHTADVTVFPDSEAGPAFPLAYTDSGAENEKPVLVVIPGGLGFASVLPCSCFRPRIARAGFRVAMAEHRGVGLSRGDAGD